MTSAAGALNVSLGVLSIPLVVSFDKFAIDIETFDVVLNMGIKLNSVPVPVPLGNVGFSMQFGMNKATVHLKILTMIDNCSTLTWNQLAIEPSVIVSMMQMMLTCRGSDDGIDQFGFKTLDALENLTLDIDLGMNQDGLMQSMDVGIDVVLPAGEIAISMDVPLESTAGGPTAEDLAIPEEWGECPEKHLGPDEIMQLVSNPSAIFELFAGELAVELAKIAPMLQETEVIA